MSIGARVELVRVDDSILSYYKGKDGLRKPLSGLAGGKATPDMAAALAKLSNAARAAGGQILVTDCYRSNEVQAAARAKYEKWLSSGKPKPGTPGYDAKTMKPAFVSRPGKSFHNAGRAVDLAHMLAAPESVPSHLKLDWLWEIAIPCGFEPILKKPTEGASEAWHFDFRGPWGPVYDRLGYEQAAMAACLDIGSSVYARSWKRWVQAQMWRCGVDLGDIDGHWGKKTARAAKELGLLIDAPKDALFAALCAMPDGSNEWIVA